MRVAHVVFQRDRQRRSPDELLLAWPTLTQVAAAARSGGADVIVTVAHSECARRQRHSIDVHFTPAPYATLRELRPDVLHVHGLHFARAIHALHSHLPGVPVIVQDHGGGLPPVYRRALMRWGLRHVRGALFTAREQAMPYRRALPATVQIYEALENSTAFTPGSQTEARRSTGLFGDPCVLWVGRLIEGKDPRTALRAVALAAEQLPDLQLWCCYSDASLEAEVRARIASHPALSSRVHLLGRVEHTSVEQLCRAADLFLSTSLAESTGYALIEALACGLVPVVTELPAHRAITGNGTIGALAPAGAAHAFARALVQLARADRQASRRRAIQHFQEHLTYDVIGRQLRAAYEAVLS